MKSYRSIFSNLFVMLGLAIFVFACSQSGDNTETSPPSPTVTATPTAIVGDSNLPTPTPVPEVCDGLGGNIEMQVLVGPSEVVGLEPLAIGTIPFTVRSDGEVNLIEGGGLIDYQDVLEKEWGTYTVEFDLEAALSGDCQGGEQSGVLNMIVETSGEQFVEIESQGYQGEFPWAGTQTFNLSFPIEEGSMVDGEGWAFVLHLDG
jgi:hypothetical protein